MFGETRVQAAGGRPGGGDGDVYLYNLQSKTVRPAFSNEA